MNKKENNKLNKALIKAVCGNDTERAARLIEAGADVNARDNENWTPLHCASWYGYAGAVRLLTSAGGDVNAKDSKTRIPLHMASFMGHVYCMRILIHMGADVNTRNNDGDTSLHEAAYRGDIDCIRLLIENGAETDIKNKYGDTPEKVLEDSHPDLHAQYIGELRHMVVASRNLGSKDLTGPANTNFEYDI